MPKFKPYKVFDNPDALAKFTNKIWNTLQKKFSRKGLFFVSSPLSSTPLLLYKRIVDDVESFDNWNKFRFVLMDEQVDGNKHFSYVPLTDSASYERFARDNFLDCLQNKVNLKIRKTLLKPDLSDLKAFDALIEEHSGIDMLILAVGAKGHYAHVMPDTPPKTGFHIAKLIPEYSRAHTKKIGGYYEGAKFRQYGMSLGPKQVLTAKNIIVMITGENKKEIAKQLLSYNAFNPEFPISIIYHPKIGAIINIKRIN